MNSGFAVLVNITTLKIDGGIGNDGQLYSGTPEIELEGKVLNAAFAPLKWHTATAHVGIEFSEPDSPSEYFPMNEEGTKQYIGSIRFNYDWTVENTDPDVSASVSIRLPITMFQQIAIMDGKQIRIDFIYDEIEAKPDKKGEYEYLGKVALVQEVYFETTSDPEPEKQKQSWPNIP